MSPRLRTAVVLAVGVVVITFAADWLVHSPSFLKPRDFLEYWSAGAVNLRGGNPYDPAVILVVQQQAEPDRTVAVMMWNPPWALAVYQPLGWLSDRWAMLAWVGGQIAAIMWSCRLLWLTFGGPARYWWVAYAAGLMFVGSWWTVTFGQNTGLLLLGLAGFAYYRQADRPAVAGAFAALTALKPHLLAVFGVLLLIDAVLTRRGRVVLLAGASVIAASLGVAVLANPAVIAQFAAAVRDPGPGAIPLHGWVLPVASYWLRVSAAPERFWVQFVPCVLACAGYAAYRVRQGPRWNWTAELPAVVWLSVLTTPYGGWIFDLTVLLVPVVQAAVWVTRTRRWVIGVGLVVGQLAILAASLAWVYTLDQFYWVAPAVLAWYLAAAVLVRPAGPE